MQTELSSQGFIKDLTRADAAEVQAYVSEIKANGEFHRQLAENRNAFGSSSFFSWEPGIGATLGTVLYALCRRLKPEKVVETGVASGVSSSYILYALEENQFGHLYSIDLPWRRYGAYSRQPEERYSGWLIPAYLKHRWQLILGKSSERLLPLLEQLKVIDMFLHDSEHTYQNMFWEYETAWMYLKSGGILLSHNIDMNDAFADFCRGTGIKSSLLGDMGGIVKPQV